MHGLLFLFCYVYGTDRANQMARSRILGRATESFLTNRGQSALGSQGPSVFSVQFLTLCLPHRPMCTPVEGITRFPIQHTSDVSHLQTQSLKILPLFLAYGGAGWTLVRRRGELPLLTFEGSRFSLSISPPRQVTSLASPGHWYFRAVPWDIEDKADPHRFLG